MYKFLVEGPSSDHESRRCFATVEAAIDAAAKFIAGRRNREFGIYDVAIITTKGFQRPAERIWITLLPKEGAERLLLRKWCIQPEGSTPAEVVVTDFLLPGEFD